jgi:hypothetical protein
MGFNYRKLINIKGQECFDTKSVWVEIIDNNNNAIGEIRIQGKEYEIIFYKNSDHIGMVLSELEEIIKKAKSSLKESSSQKIKKLKINLQGDVI